MLIPDRLDDLFASLQEAKEQYGVEPMPPAIMFFTDNGIHPMDLGSVVEATRLLVGDGKSPLPGAVLGATWAVRCKENVHALAIASDSWSVAADEDEVDEVLSTFTRHGDMERDYHTNPNTKVRELLVMLVLEDDLCGGWNQATVTCTYRRDDQGQPIWDEPKTMMGPDKGVVSAAALHALTNDPPAVSAEGMTGVMLSADDIPTGVDDGYFDLDDEEGDQS